MTYFEPAIASVLKRRPKSSPVPACGHTFSWQEWSREHNANRVYTGNPAPAAEFAVRWPRCSAAKARMIAIDQLIHGVHVGGALAHFFIEGHEADVVGMLNKLVSE